ncbi:MAG: hypothetical protein JOZ80_11030 [Acidobacteriaceae bacterium]|nr:hypothetical protein [Acidobacteriaceae bacterium]
MKKHYASILLTLASLIGLGLSAVAEQPEAVATVPFPFVAAGRLLPAGKYTVSRVSDDGVGQLSIRNYEKGVGALVLASNLNRISTDTSKLTFEQVGDMHYLHTIASHDGVYTIDLPRSVNLVAGTKQQGNMSASGTN